MWTQIWPQVCVKLFPTSDSLTQCSDSLLRHMKDLHDQRPSAEGVVQTQRNVSLNNSAADGPLQTSLSSYPSGGVDPGTTDPFAHVEAQLIADHSNIPGFAADSTFLTGDLTGGYEAWLTNDNLDGLLTTWPFAPADSGDLTWDTLPCETVEKPLTDLQQAWHTYLDAGDQAVSGRASPLPRDGEVDDSYRQSLQRRLRVPSNEQNLPTAEYLNLCIEAYFNRFHHVFPVIHAATFRPTRTNSVLLLSICSIGSLLTGYPTAVQRGTQLFERLNRAILANWESIMRRGPDDSLAMVQAALIGQTFALLSGQSKHLALADAFHGTVVSWARRAKLFQQKHVPSNNHGDLESRWRSWARNEEQIRVGLGLRIHDSEMAALLHHETIIPATYRNPHAESDTLFYAPNAQEWQSLRNQSLGETDMATSAPTPGALAASPEVLQQRLVITPSHSGMDMYATLQDIASTITQARLNEELDESLAGRIQYCLSTSQSALQSSDTEPMRIGIHVLWHFLHIMLYSDLDLLEQAIGRDGPDVSEADLSRVRGWALSSNAKRSAAHALRIRALLDSLSLTSEPAIHIPRCALASAICLLSYRRHGGAQIDGFEYFPEIAAGRDERSTPRLSGRHGALDSEAGILCGFIDVLRRMGHWEVSRKFASILEVLLLADNT